MLAQEGDWKKKKQNGVNYKMRKFAQSKSDAQNCVYYSYK